MNISSIKITTYNVENLFDREDDPFKDDGPPKPDNEKLALAEVLKSLNSDIISLQEVENKQILEEVLSIAGLKERYNIIVGKSDGRGIACALLIDKKFPIKSYTINENEKLFYRPPIEAIVELAPGLDVKIISVHFKAKMDPKSEEQRKKEALRTIELASKDNIPTIIMGDFNDIPNVFIDARSLDKLSKDVDAPTHYSIEYITYFISKFSTIFYNNLFKAQYFETEVNINSKKPSIVDYIMLGNKFSSKFSVVQGSFDVLEKHENPNTAIASDHRLVSLKIQIRE